MVSSLAEQVVEATVVCRMSRVEKILQVSSESKTVPGQLMLETLRFCHGFMRVDALLS